MRGHPTFADWESGPPEVLWFSQRLSCGHTVAASEESGGFDEVPVVTEAMVRELLAFKIRVHDCERTEARLAEASRRAADRNLQGPF